MPLDEYTDAVKLITEIHPEPSSLSVGQGHSPHAKPFQSSQPTPFQKATILCGPTMGPDQDGGDSIGAKADANALHGAKEPFYHIQSERAEHRVMIFLKAQGHSNIEIARATGFTSVAVSNILRQPWAARRIVEEITLAGRDEVAELLQGAAADSVLKLIQLRDDANGKVPPAVQKSAADAILDRVYGKPNQRFEHTYNKNPEDMSDDELQRIVKQGRTGTPATATRTE